MKSLLFPFLVISVILGCSTPQNDPEESLHSVDWDLPDKPNFLWLVAEDLSPVIPPFGDSTITTPTLSRLAEEGIRYTNMYSPSGVCAPSRAAIATGMYPTSIGANHMRTHSYTDVTGLPPYEAVPPPEVKMISEMLRRNGYYCTNNLKTDYQFRMPVTAWDESGPYAHWRNRPDGRPFFSIFNFTVTHESGLFEPYGFPKRENRHYRSGEIPDNPEDYRGRLKEEETPVHVPKNQHFPVPPYLPDTDSVQRDLWKMYNNIAEMDRQLAAVLKQLEEDGLLENTIIFFYGDHGGPMPHQKRMIYDAGLRVPLIIRYPDRIRAGQTDTQLISFIDLAPTLLALAGIPIPAYLQGRAFVQGDTPERNYIHAAADRFDGVRDIKRAVRDDRFKYIRNYRPEQGYYLPVSYRERIPTMRELLRMNEVGALNEYQSQWFRNSKPREELFDCLNDPFELHNLADDPEYSDKLDELSSEMDRWLEDIGDDPTLPERDLIRKLWEGAEEKPATAIPIIEEKEGQLYISCATEGASIAYRQVNGTEQESEPWVIYEEPLIIPDSTTIEVIAHRIGYDRSEIVKYSN